MRGRGGGGDGQPQPVVCDGGGEAGLEDGELLEPPDVAALAAASQASDGRATRRGRDPRGGVVGNAIGRPPLQRNGEGILHRLLGEVEIAQDTDEGRVDPPRLLAEDTLDSLPRRAHACIVRRYFRRTRLKSAV